MKGLEGRWEFLFVIEVNDEKENLMNEQKERELF